MKNLRLILLLFITIAFSKLAPGQTIETADALVKQGVALHDAGKYPEAIDKYKEALKLTPNDTNAQYELSYTLVTAKRGKEAIPYLEKITVKNVSPEAYDLLASIYDEDQNYQKSEAYYKQGIIAFPDFQRLRFNAAISYIRQGKYIEAENNAIEAIRLDPEHASSQRAYALATGKQNKFGNSLLAWCSFLFLEPQSSRSKEAVGIVKTIINKGIKVTDEKNVSLTIDQNDHSSANLAMSIAVMSATADKKNLSPVDSLTLQLTSVFKLAHEITDEKPQSFVSKYFADYFANLATSGNMPGFVRYITLSAYGDENKAWFKDHEKEITAFDAWASATQRGR